MKPYQKQLYEKRRLEYLLENKLGEIEAYREELGGLREINSLCAAFILYFLSDSGSGADGETMTMIEKKKIAGLVGRYSVGCVSDGDFYKITLTERQNEKA